MALTAEQLSVLGHDITVVHADEFATALANNDDQVIADAYNLAAVPDFWSWRTSVAKAEVIGATSGEGTRFTWAGNGFISRTVSEILCWQELWDVEGNIDPSQLNVRQAFADIFSGTGNAAANRSHCLIVARRRVTRAERLFVSGPGTTAVPGMLGWEGEVTYLDIAAAVRPPAGV